MLSNVKDGPVLAFATGLVTVVGIVVLSATSKTVPTELWALASAAIGGGLGITNPSSSASSTGASTVDELVDQAGGGA